MKRKFTFLSLLMVLFATMLSGCGDDYFYGDPDPYMRDPRLYGDWKLVTYNGNSVADNATNFLELNNSGRGFYYYYSKGVLVQENISYWVQPGASPSANYQINIRYSDGTASTMNYWFTDRDTSLWLQWHTNQGAVTYMYKLVNSIP